MRSVAFFLGGIIVCLSLALFAAVLSAPTIALGQTVCLGTDAECRAAQKQLCKDEPAPANLSVAHPVRRSGTFFDPTGAPIDFDAVKPDHRTIVQIKSPVSGEILFAVPLRPNGDFEFELVPQGNYRLILVWMKDGKFTRLPLADQPKEIRCSDMKQCRISSVISFHGTDNPIDFCPPK
jgi:hypothetical protein